MVARKAIKFLLSAFILLGTVNAYAEEGTGAVDTPEEIKAYIKHHLQDSHDFIFYTDGETGEHVGFSLPVILWDGGLHTFSSGDLHHGETVVESNGNFYKLYHAKIYKTDAFGKLTFEIVNEKNDSVLTSIKALSPELALSEYLSTNQVDSLVAEKIIAGAHPIDEMPLDLSITKSVVGMLLTGLLMILMFGSLAKGYKKGAIPTGLGRFLEPLVIYVRDEIARPNIGETKYKKFMPYLLTVFFFIWIANLLGLTPLGFNVTGQIAITVCLALFTFIIVNINGNKDYWGHIFWMPGVPVPMKIILAPIEVLGMLTKPFSLLIRLFANITAGHFVVMSLIAIMYMPGTVEMLGKGGASGLSIFLTLFISLIELLVAFLQAFIFTMLSSLFIGMATEEHAHH